MRGARSPTSVALAALIAGLLPGAVAAQGGPDGSLAVLPFELVENRLRVPVSVDDAGPFPFIVDSGAGATVLDWHLADSLGLEPRVTASTRGAGPGRMRVGRSEPAAVTMGPVRLSSGRAVTMPLDSALRPWNGSRTGGVVGYPFFRNHVVEIDFEGRFLRIWPADARVELPGALEVPLDVERPWAHVEAEIHLPGAGPRDARLIVDTGASDALYLTTRWTRREGLTGRLSDAPKVSVGAGIGGEARLRARRIDSLRVGPLVVRRPVALMSEDEALDLDTDGILGTEILRRYRVILDYPRERMLLFPGTDSARVDQVSLAGLVIWAPEAWTRGGGAPVRVREVRPRSAAERAGLEPGDRIVRLDGRSVTASDLDRARQRLRSGPGETVSLSVERDGEVLSVDLVLEHVM